MALANLPALDSELIVDRSKWYRGHGGDQSRLLIPDYFTDMEGHPNPYAGHMCCLGFYCLSVGATRNEIVDRAFPGTALLYLRQSIHDEPRQREKLLAPALEWLEENTDPDADDPNSINVSDRFEYVIGRVNDNAEIDDATREAILTRLFARKGIALKFIDSTPDAEGFYDCDLCDRRHRLGSDPACKGGDDEGEERGHRHNPDYCAKCNGVCLYDDQGELLISEEDEDRRTAVTCDCGKIVAPDDDYFATPCGTHCNDCMTDHVRGCGICAAEFPEAVDEPEPVDAEEANDHDHSLDS